MFLYLATTETWDLFISNKSPKYYIISHNKTMYNLKGHHLQVPCILGHTKTTRTVDKVQVRNNTVIKGNLPVALLHMLLVGVSLLGPFLPRAMSLSCQGKLSLGP